MCCAPRSRRVLVLGIGNILWADEGFGVRAVEEFHRRFACPENVTVMDGGTQGLYLVPHVAAADALVVFDAVDYGLDPGSLMLVHDDEVPKFAGIRKMSLHQTGFQEVLSAAQLLGSGPKSLLLIGCQPLDLEDWGGPLTPPVRAQIEPTLAAACAALRQWGIAPAPRAAPLAVGEGLLGHSTDHDAYERRPAATGI